MATDFKLEQRAYIRALLGLSPSDILADLQIVHKDNSASYSNVKYWAKRFREGQKSLEVGFWSGRSKSVTTSGNILEVEWLVEEDPHITVEEIAMRVGMSTGAAHAILVDEMKASKICSRWIPHALTETQKDNRVRCAGNLLAQYELADPRRLCEIVTGEESWIIYDEPLSKERNKVWVLKGDGPSLIPRPDFRDQKVLYSIFLMHKVQWPRLLSQREKQSLENFMPTAYQKSINTTGSEGLSQDQEDSSFYTIMLGLTKLSS